jgi:hypothetical protein
MMIDLAHRLCLAAAALGLVCAAPAGAASSGRCAPIETVPGVKIRPATCPPPAQPAFRDTKSDDALETGSRPGFFKFGDTQVRIGGRVRVEGGYVSQP